MNGRGIDEVGRVGYEYFSSLLYFIRIKQIIILTHARKKELHVNGTQQRGYDRIENGRFISQPDTGARLYSIHSVGAPAELACRSSSSIHASRHSRMGRRGR